MSKAHLKVAPLLLILICGIVGISTIGSYFFGISLSIILTFSSALLLQLPFTGKRSGR